MNPLSLIAPATVARHNARAEAARFAAGVQPGHTYYSVVNNHARHPGVPRQLLLEWVFSAPGRWIGQEARHGHLTAAGAWLGYGPLHENRPGGLMTHAEFSSRPGVAGPEVELHAGDLTPAGV